MEAKPVRRRKTAPNPHSSSKKGKPGLTTKANKPSIIGKCCKVFLLVIVGIIVLGSFLNLVLSNFVELKPPGELIPFGHYGQQLHLYCRLPSPPRNDFSDRLIIFEAGAGRAFYDWVGTQEILEAKHIPSCSFDRPGLGFSTPDLSTTPAPRVPAEFVKELHAALIGSTQLQEYNSNITNLILVGHSLGGITVRLFANAHPERVKGLVLVDPAPEYTFPKELFETIKKRIFALGIFDKLGIIRLASVLGFHLWPITPNPMQDIAKELSLRTFSAAQSEINNIWPSLREFIDVQQITDNVHDVPIIFLIAPEDMHVSDDNVEQRVASASQASKFYSNSEIRQVPGSDHMTILSNSQEIIQAILDVSDSKSVQE